jgi:hypothetical protein
MEIGGSSASGLREVGNDVSCPTANSDQGCYMPYAGNTMYFLGNNLHDAGATGSNNTLYHAIYIGGGIYNVEIGWNQIYNVQGCRGIQLYSGGSPVQLYNQNIHDNTIHDTTCDGIGMYQMYPSLGPVTIYNNLIYRAGQGPAGSSGEWTGIMEEEQGGESGTIEIFNNTLFSNGNATNTPYGGGNAGIINFSGTSGPLLFHMRNNIIYQTNSGAVYFADDTGVTNGIYGTNNLMYGISASTTSSYVTGTLTSNPSLTNTAVTGCPDSCVTDLHLSSSSSPANGAGTPITGVTPFGTNWIGHDHDGLQRSATPSIGAYEFTAGTVTRPNPPANLRKTAVQ